MKKVNTKMKLLSLAILGLGGIALAGSASAACPSSPDAWTGTSLYQGAVSISSPGFDSTSCLMNSTINSGASGFASAVVHDASPSAEPRYRAAFALNLDNFSNPTLSTGAQVFSATSSAGPLKLGIFGSGGAWYLSYFVGASTSGAVPLSAGVNHIEFDLQIGASGSLTLWVNSNSQGSPTVAPITVNSSSMVGIDDAYLGLAAPTPVFVSNFGGTAAQFDQFDSRRQTFIGY